MDDNQFNGAGGGPQSDTTTAVRATALLAQSLGLAVLPPVEDGTKRPLGNSWKRYQEQPATRAEVETWYRNGRSGVGLVTGAVSGKLELFEFDALWVYEAFKQAAATVGLADLVGRIEAGYLEETPGGGVHWLYFAGELRSATKLATRPEPTADNPRNVKTLIETKGEGGFVIIAPSCGRVHPSGKPYKLLRGGLNTIVTLSDAERDELWTLARTFNEDKADEQPKSKPWTVEPPPNSSGWEVSPGDDFDHRARWEEVLVGWSFLGERGGTTYLRRPGKDRGISAAIRADRLNVYTTSTKLESVLSSRKTYDRFGAYTALNHGGDFTAAARDLHARGFGKAKPAPGGSVGSVGSSPEESPKFEGQPRPITADLLPVPALDPELLPKALRPWLVDIADRGCLPLEYPAATAIVVLGSLLGRKLAIRPKRHDDWLELANLWGAIVGMPGVLKSPAVAEVLRQLKRLVADAQREHEGALKTHQVNLEVAGAKAAAARENLKKAAKEKKDDTELRRLATEAQAETDTKPPTARRYMVNDTTVEKLGELLAENPNGLLQFRDELAGFLRTLDKQGHEADRGFYLESWSGLNDYVYDRIGRGTIRIPSTTLSIFGTIQPGPLARYLRGAASGEEADGFVQRFQLLVYPDPPAAFVNVDRYPEKEAKNKAFEVFQALASLEPKNRGCSEDEDRKLFYLGFNRAAQDFFDEWRTDLENRLRGGQEHALFACHLAKYRKLMPALALVFHVVEVFDRNPLPSVSVEATELSAAWCDLLEAHARRVYQSALDGDPELAMRLAERLKQSLPNPFTFRQVAQKGWSGLDSVEAVRQAVGVLEDRGWVRVVEIPPGAKGGRPTERVWVHPQIAPTSEEGGEG